jgi:PKD repeat protein
MYFSLRIIGLTSVLMAVMVGCNKTPPAPIPDANFFVENNGCVAPCYVYFYDQSENATSVQWNFGNGMISNERDDSTQYMTYGIYEVWLFAENSDGVRDSVRKNVFIN